MGAMDWVPSTILAHKTYVGSVPAAGAEWSFVVPSSPPGKSWTLKAVTVALAANASAGTTTQPVLVLDDGTNIFAESTGATTAQAVSTTVLYTWAANLVLSGIQGVGADQHAQAPLPGGGEMSLQAGWRIRSHTINNSVNLQYGAPVIYVAEDG